MDETQVYIEDVKRYAPDAELDRVESIIYYCGIVLRSRYLPPVSCSSETENNHIRDGFCIKRLGMDPAEASAAIEVVCQAMKTDRNKNRVTFYYLLAKHSGKLEML